MIRIRIGNKTPIKQYDLEDNLIRNWESVTDASIYFVNKVRSLEYNCPKGYIITVWSSLDAATDYLTNLVLSDENTCLDSLKSVNIMNFRDSITFCLNNQKCSFLEYKWSCFYEYPDPDEYFKDHPCYNISCSNLGRIIFSKELVTRGCLTKRGYVFRHHALRKTFMVHNLIGETFFPDYTNAKTIVIHLDGDKSNNRLENLRRVTRSENLKIIKIINLFKCFYRVFG